MQLRYEEDFVEAVVALAAAGRCAGVPSLQVARFHRQREKLYSILDPEERNQAFFELHLEWFREWGLERRLVEPVGGFGLLAGALAVLAFRKSRSRNDEGAELYVNPAGERHGVMALRPERLGRGTDLEGFLRHELMHLQDMVDPKFGYRPELPVAAISPSQERLALERYRLLWDITIDGRLSRGAREPDPLREQRWTDLNRGFGFWGEARQRQVFDALWTGSAPTHERLTELACEAREPGLGQPLQPGAPCPLCGFPTFDWADPQGLSEGTAAAIRHEFPRWTSGQGTCGRCAKVYRSQALLGLGQP